MSTQHIQNIDGARTTVVATIPTEDILVRSKIGYIPQYVTEVFGKTRRVTKDVTLCKLLKITRNEFPNHELISLGTPVNFDIAPTHLTRVEMHFNTKDQVEKCLKEISVSDLLIRTRIQPAWDWQAVLLHGQDVILHVGWYDTVYFLQFKDIFLGDLHCRYSAKFCYEPKDARITHFRYTNTGDLEEVRELNEQERRADAIKSEVEFLRVFRDGSIEHT